MELAVHVDNGGRNKTPEHTEVKKFFIINISESKTKTHRYFVVPRHFYPTVKKYMKIRSTTKTATYLPFFK